MSRFRSAERMTAGKKRTIQQMMEDESLAIIQRLLPREWVVHDYSPDYGIDFVIELFAQEHLTSSTFTSLGEVLFIQAKAVKSVASRLKTITTKNVADHDVDVNEEARTDVVAFSIDTALLKTIRAMGPALPVLLVVVSLEDETLFFLCLNDYIDKVLAEHKAWNAQDEVTVYIPTANCIKERGVGFDPFEIYAQRPKLYAAFNIFSYQLNELGYMPTLETVQRFYAQVLSFDFWYRRVTFQPIHQCYAMLLSIGPIIESGEWLRDELARARLDMAWEQLANLSRLHESMWRNKYLPTALGLRLGNH